MIRVRIFLLVTLLIPAWPLLVHAQIHPIVELESEPPDEPTAAASPEIKMVPGPAPTPSSTGSNEELPWADQVAHPPEIVTYVVPDYPAKARERGVQGRVMLAIVIDESGKVDDPVQVVDSIPLLDRAAIDAVHRWSFTPARDDKGNPVTVQMEVPVPFVLK
jgi:TonB family protein